MSTRNLSRQQFERLQEVSPESLSQHGKYRLWDRGGGFITAHHGTDAGGVVGGISFYTGKVDRHPDGTPDDRSNVNGGVVHQLFVNEKHRRKGIASALLAFARSRYPELDVRHSGALSDEGKAFAEARP